MTTGEQKQFVRELSETIVRGIIEQIEEGKIPEAWDGHELRCLLAERHRQSAAMSNIVKNKRSDRSREFRNTCLVNNL